MTDRAAAAPREVRTIDDVDTLKAMADPTRMAILYALTKTADLPVMSAKELAAELGEPQTKLYRHLRHLEAAGLIRVAATRVVSGIIEQRYQACQREVMFGPGILRDHSDEAEQGLRVLFDQFRDGFFAAVREGRLPMSPAEPGEPRRTPEIHLSELMLPLAEAVELKRKLGELKDWLGQVAEDPDGVPVGLLIGFYSPDRRPDG